ncbi:MAG TPA: hypothetical protein PKA88_08250 [Polyangiaceae bacterium]|nr:hypothetical protein [Polyangiaceae bacterium]
MAAARVFALEVRLPGGERTQYLACHVVATVFTITIHAGQLHERGCIGYRNVANVLGLADGSVRTVFLNVKTQGLQCGDFFQQAWGLILASTPLRAALLGL